MAFALTELWSALRTALLVLVMVVWGVAVIIIGVKGGAMERPHRVSQLYGYTVCLVALITILLTLPGIVDNLFTLSNPAQVDARFGFGASLGSFEAYKASQGQGRGMAEALAGRDVPAEPPLSEEQLRTRYEALRADQIASNRFDAQRALVRNGLLLVLALGLFGSHWRWLRRQPETVSTKAAA
jgi:hypothetical protein